MGNNFKFGLLKSKKSILLALGGIFVFGGQVHAKFDGFYVGGSMGYLQQNTSINAAQNPANPRADTYNAIAGRGLSMVEAMFGWGREFLGCFYWGVEGKVDWVIGRGQNVAEDISFVYQSGRKGPGVAALARLGFLISPQTMIYGGIGVKVANFEHNMFEKADQISAPFSKRTAHLLTELGLETFSNAIKNLAFRFSYSFMPKRDLKQRTSQFPINHMYHGYGIWKVGTTEHAVKLGVVYHF